MLSTTTPTPARALAVLGVGLLAVSTGALFIRFAQTAGVPSLAIAAVRLTLSTLVLLPIAALQHGATIRALPARSWVLVALSGFFLALHFASWITSLEYTTITNSAVLVSVSPIFVALIARAFLREPIGVLTWIGLLVAIAGSVLIALGDACTSPTGCAALSGSAAGGSLLGDGLALAGAAAVAVYLVIGRRLRQYLDLVPYITLTYGAAALTLLAFCLATATPLTGYPPLAYLWLFLLALVPQTIGHTSFNWALKHLPTTFVSVATMGEPILASLLALVILGESPTPIKMLGGVIVLVGIWLATKSSGVQPQVSETLPRQEAGPGGRQADA
jgi:drug/metabolite transporter (DMT)-like permease